MAEVSYLSTKSVDYTDKYTNVRMRREDGIHFWADTPARTSKSVLQECRLQQGRWSLTANMKGQ